MTAAELKPLNLHYMPTLADDVQAALADEKVLFQNQHVTCVVANDRYVVYRPRLVGHRAGACAAGAAGESRSRLTAAGGLGPCRPTSRVASQAAREAGSARRGSPTVARLRAHEGPSSGVRTRRPARPFPSGARAKAGGLATPEERGPFRKSRAVDRLPWPWRAAPATSSARPPRCRRTPWRSGPRAPRRLASRGGADADAPGRAVADGDEHGRPALAGGRGGRAGAPPRVDRPGDGGAAVAAGAARRAGARGGGRAAPARRPRRPAPGGAGAAAARSARTSRRPPPRNRPAAGTAPGSPASGIGPTGPGRRGRPRAAARAAVDGRARDAPDATGRGGPVRPAGRG